MTDITRNDIDQLVQELGGKDAVQRRKTREELIRTGSAAVSALLDALDSPQQHVRWEAAKALAEIRDADAAPRLVAALADEDTDVRWVVGTALIALGRDGLEPLLEALTQSDLPDGVYRGAHHVLHDLAKQDDLAPQLQPVLKALDEPEPGVAVPFAAAKALKGL